MAPPFRSETDKALPRPYALEPEVRKHLEEILRSQQLFAVRGEGLSFITCRKRVGEYTVGIANNTWRQQPFQLESRCGRIESARELRLDESEKAATGYTPESVEISQLGTNGPATIAGGDVRIFAVKVAEASVQEIPHVTPPACSHGRVLPLLRARSIKEEILSRPTFFQHFDGVCVDWSYLRERERRALAEQAGWLKRQGLGIVVDLSSGLNLFPTLRLVDNLRADYESSLAAIEDVLSKMEILGARDLVFSLHRHPENNFTEEQTRAAFATTLKALAGQAARRNVTLHLRLTPGKPPWSLAEGLEWLDRVGAPNLKLAASTALLDNKPPPPQQAARLKAVLGLWLVAGTRADLAGHSWDAHAPVHSAPSRETLSEILSLAPAVPLLFDVPYFDRDQEFLDVMALKQEPN